MESSTPSWTVLAQLLRPQGRKGEVLAELLTDFPESLVGRKNLFLVPQGFEGPESEARSIEVVSSWLPVGKNRGRIVLQLAGVDSISEADALGKLDLAVPEQERLTLDVEASYVSDLTGCSVYDGDVLIGEVTGVQFPAAPDGLRLEGVASLLEIASPEGHEILVPFVKQFLTELNVADRRIVLKLPAGLAEVNR